MWNDFPSFLTCYFYIFASFTPGKQLYVEISEMTTNIPCARDYWWTLDQSLDFANAFLSPDVNSQAELVPSRFVPLARGKHKFYTIYPSLNVSDDVTISQNNSP
jgi:hypothetical protein